jgi:hypothetical protein
MDLRPVTPADLDAAATYVWEWARSDNCDDTPEYRAELDALAGRLKAAAEYERRWQESLDRS